MMLWIVNWMLTHVTIGFVVLAIKSEDIKRAGLHSLYAFAIVLAIPQIRNAVPDAPDLDGELGLCRPSVRSSTDDIQCIQEF